MAEIKGISYYLPKKVITNLQLSELFPEWSVQKIADKVGIKNRFFSYYNTGAFIDNIKTSIDTASYIPAFKWFVI